MRLLKNIAYLTGLLIVVFIFFLSTFSVSAQRYAVCDQCGFCISPTPTPAGAPPHDPPPQSWEACRKCLYPGVAANSAASLSTLVVDPNTNVAVTTFPGHYYTGIGCFSTDLQNYLNPDQQSAAAGTVTQGLLRVIFSLSGGLAFIFLMYGAFLIMTARGDPDRLRDGKRTVYGSIVGLIFILSSVFIINLLASGVLKIPGF